MKRTIETVEIPIPPLPKITRVAAYARVSVGSESLLHSLSAQVSYYNKMIQDHKGWMYCGVYADEAISGTLNNRENFKRLLEDCRQGKIDMVITKSISRFSRNTVTTLNAVRELKSLGIDVFFEEQNIHTLSAEGELMLTILASYAQEESRSVSENLKWRVKRKFEQGIPWECTMYGYRLNGNKLVIEPTEADVVKRIYQKYLSGKGYQAIANELSEEHIPSRFGHEEWGYSSVKNILSNKIYTGNLLLQTYYTENYLTKVRKKNSGEMPMYQVSDSHEAIIPMEVFTAVQDEIKRRAAKRNIQSVSNVSYPFTSLIVCDICGKKYKRRTTASRKTWCCATYLTKGKQHCHSKQIPEKVLYEITEDIELTTVTQITAKDGNILVFKMKDGTEFERKWKDISRAEGWTEDMRMKARERALEQWRKKNGTS